jgi:hypothetical protein
MSIYSILGQEFFMLHGANYTFTNDPWQIFLGSFDSLQKDQGLVTVPFWEYWTSPYSSLW